MKYLYIAFLMFVFNSYAQDTIQKPIDLKYKEDQLYLGVTYNLLNNRPTSISQRGFSTGVSLGIIKDMPINADRTVAIGLGLGYAISNYNHNMLIDSRTETVAYSVLSDNSTYSKNKFITHELEVPLEFRWRNSTASEYKFWRIYSGLKASYVFAHRTKYDGDLGKISNNAKLDFNTFQYGATLSAGYNTWNFYCYYGLNTLLTNNATLNGEQIDFSSIKVGLMFYLL